MAPIIINNIHNANFNKNLVLLYEKITPQYIL